MIDKVQKIREEVERIQLYTQSEVLKQVLDYIDEVQKKPVSEDLEEAAYKAYPYNGDYRGQGDSNSKFREVYIKGYLQAEKDLELTWKDVKAIFLLVQVEWSPNKNEEEIYQEVLKRFRNFKERKEK